MFDRCILQMYHPRSRSEEVCSLDKARAQRGVYRNCKLLTFKLSDVSHLVWVVEWLFEWSFHQPYFHGFNLKLSSLNFKKILLLFDVYSWVVLAWINRKSTTAMCGDLFHQDSWFESCSGWRVWNEYNFSRWSVPARSWKLGESKQPFISCVYFRYSRVVSFGEFYTNVYFILQYIILHIV